MKILVFPAKLEHLPAMLECIRGAAREQGFDEKKLNQLRLAAEEVLVNVINYAYPGKNGDIEITLKPQGKAGLTVTVTDKGIPFDPLSVPEPDINSPLEKRKIGGLGIFLVRKLMDEAKYTRAGDRNIFTFTKY